MDDAVSRWMEYGPVWSLVGALLLGCAYSIRWVGNHVILPAGKALIEYLSTQTEISRLALDEQRKLVLLEKDIRNTITEMGAQASVDAGDMRDAHTDPDSIFATVHTNAGIRLLAVAFGRIAEEMSVDIGELVKEIEDVLEPKHT